MKGNFFVLLYFIIFSQPLWATTFIEIPISDRLEEAEGVIRGVFSGESYKKDPSGRVVTEASFKVQSISGISPNQIVNRNTFKVLIPGGKWNGVIYKVSGVPKFKQGEEVVLILHRGDYGYILADLALSKFKIELREGEEFFISSIFSNKSGVGKISSAHFDNLLEQHFGEKLHEFSSDKFIYRNHLLEKGLEGNRAYVQRKKRGGVMRRPTSQDFKKEHDESSLSLLWPILILAIMGVFPHIMLRRGKE